MRSTLYPTEVTIILVSWARHFFWSRGLETRGSGSSRYRMSENFWHPVAHVQKLQMTLPMFHYRPQSRSFLRQIKPNGSRDENEVRISSSSLPGSFHTHPHRRWQFSRAFEKFFARWTLKDVNEGLLVIFQLLYRYSPFNNWLIN